MIKKILVLVLLLSVIFSVVFWMAGAHYYFDVYKYLRKSETGSSFSINDFFYESNGVNKGIFLGLLGQKMFFLGKKGIDYVDIDRNTNIIINNKNCIISVVKFENSLEIEGNDDFGDINNMIRRLRGNYFSLYRATNSSDVDREVFSRIMYWEDYVKFTSYKCIDN